MAQGDKDIDNGPITLRTVVSKLPPTGLAVHFVATDAERAALAEALDILSVETLDASLLLTPWHRDGVSVTGTVRADVVQACVVSLEPVPRPVREDVELLFVSKGSKLARPLQPTEELLLDPEGADAPEVFEGDRIDLGAAITEAVALGLDPYPRAPEAEFAAGAAEGDAAVRESPFAALRQLRPENGSR